MDLVPYIFFEKQEHGTSLCGQHALNNVLQSHYFEVADLAAVAQQLDAEENETLDDDRTESMNMDDTGFFSVQVLDRCLQVWGLKLERWRSEEMKQEWEQPELQNAFILNLSQHWFPIRRFGRQKWFNLNSFNEQPQAVSNLYLGMTLDQAEAEGYSVFVLRPNDPAQAASSSSAPEPSILETSRADRMAEQLALSGLPENAQASETGAAVGNSTVDWASYGNFDDEDAELQAALAASVASTSDSSALTAPSSRSISSLPSRPPSARRSSLEPDDPVSASRARAQAQLERFQRDQAAALRGEDVDMVSGIFGNNSHSTRLGPSSRAGNNDSGFSGESPRNEMASSSRRRRQGDPEPVALTESDDDAGDPPASLRLPTPRRRQSAEVWSPSTASQPPRRHDEDEEMMRRAIAESLREQQVRDGLATSTGAWTAMNAEDDSDEVEEMPVEDDDYGFNEAVFRPPSLPAYLDTSVDLAGFSRNYDEEDAELQRAIKASMAGLPEGFEIPVLALPPPQPSPFIRRPSPPPVQVVTEPASTSKSDGSGNDEGNGDEEDDDHDAAEAPALTPEQIRALRLARFG